MGHSEKCNTSQLPSMQSAAPDKKRYKSMRARLSGRANPSPIDRNATKANKPAFFKDFMQEHSLPGTRVPLIALAGCF
jgi:hypothetical protein